MLRITMHSEHPPNRHQYQQDFMKYLYHDRLDKDELRKAVAYMKSENEEEHERNIKYDSG